MKLNGRTVLICDCEKTMRLDASALGRALGTEAPVVHTQLCRAQLGAFERAADTGEPVLVACTQEAPLFAETRPDAALAFANIRERAGWSDEGAQAGPKIAALLAEAALEVAPTPTVTLNSAGVTLIYGTDERAIEAARQVRDRLDVTVLLTRHGDIEPPDTMDVPVLQGTIVRASGHLGAFEVVVDGYAAPSPSSRERLVFGAGRDGAVSRCDLILDLTGGTPLFPGGERRDGYLRPDPGNPAAVQRALLELTALVGEFEKPRYVAFEAALCAHSRSRKTGCTRCLDVCPTGAIAPAGDVVAIDAAICAGCGHCAAVCPTGAATYAVPRPEDLATRLRTLLLAFRKAGGAAPVLLVHDPERGAATIAAIARHEGGLPAAVLPFAVNEVTSVGLDLLAAAFAWGATRVVLLTGGRRGADAAVLAQQAGLAETVLAGLGYGSGRIQLVDEADPARLAGLLRAPVEASPAAGAFLPMGGTRARTMLALRHLHDAAPDPVPRLLLPAGAPFGAVVLDAAGCTLCLACVGACPTGALLDNPEKPMLRFQEEACVQCGLCRATCPEGVITLKPRLDFTAAARDQAVLKEEEPASCVRCGKPFGSQASIERIVAKLTGHAMFANAAAIDRIRMCEDCRVIAQFEAPNPLAGAARPVPRTTDDDLAERDAPESS